ncbi:C10 family peptidase [bacterium]|nr:C10 family peptidase [bacterium]
MLKDFFCGFILPMVSYCLAKDKRTLEVFSLHAFVGRIAFVELILLLLIILMGLVFAFGASTAFCSQTRYLNIAQNFLSFLHSDKKIVSVESIESIEGSTTNVSLPKITVAYLMNLEKGGFILVAASEGLTPVKAYSLQNDFQTLPPAYRRFLLEDLEYNTRALRENTRILKRADVDDEIRSRWDFLENYDRNRILYKYEPDTFLLKTTWQQKLPYNRLLPEIDGNNVVAGCVNVAMGQIMRYHNYPLSGKGVVSYNWNGQTLKAVLYKDYHWENMPDKLDMVTDGYKIDEVSRLLRDLGISNETDFGLRSSSATVNTEALIKNFGYSKYIGMMEKKDEDQFFAKIRAEIDANRPLLLRFPNHMAVADGYGSDPTGKKIHVNFGWGGTDDGYYFLDQNIITTSHIYPPDNLAIYHNIKPCSGDDCYTNLEQGDRIQGSSIIGRFNSAKDTDEYEVYLKGQTTIIGTRGYIHPTQAFFFISLYDSGSMLVSSNYDNPNDVVVTYKTTSVYLPSGKYRVKASLCFSNLCYGFDQDYLDYGVYITTGYMTSSEKAAIDANSDIPPRINNNFRDFVLNYADVPYKILIDAVDENGDEISLSALSSNINAAVDIDDDGILTITANEGAAGTGSKITVSASANGKTAVKSFIVLVLDEHISFGKEFEVAGRFLDQNTYNKHKVILDGTCNITGYNAAKDQEFFDSVMDADESYLIYPTDHTINSAFSQDIYLIGASLWQNPESLSGIKYIYEDGKNDTYLIRVCCPDADDDIDSILNILGMGISPGAEISAYPLSHDFGAVAVGGNSVRTFALASKGAAPLEIKDVHITGNDKEDFAIVTDNCSGKTLDLFETCTVDTAFLPSSAGAKTADIAVSSNDPNASTFDIQLSGTGKPPNIKDVGESYAYSSIQDAINAASHGDIIIVHDGVYIENIAFSGKPITVCSENGPARTVIDGGGAGSVVRFDQMEDANSALRGFTIKNGNAERGGGIICDNSSPVIAGCFIKENIASSKGGGIYCRNGSAQIINCKLLGNTANGAPDQICLETGQNIYFNDARILNYAGDSRVNLKIFDPVQGIWLPVYRFFQRPCGAGLPVDIDDIFFICFLP